MNYFYDITVNFQKENFNYFEWLKSDKLTILKKVPIYLINREDFLKVYNHSIKIEMDFLKEIFEKTLCKEKEYQNSVILCDKSNCLVISFDSNGQEIKRSNLDFNDDENICELAYTLKKIKLKYKVLLPIDNTFQNRRIMAIKDAIINELKGVYNNKEYLKIKYYYYEIYNLDDDNYEFMYQELIKYIENNPLSSDYLRIINIKNSPIA